MDFSKIKATTRIKLPGFFDEKEEIEVEVRRLTPAALISSGKLQNPLFETAYGLFFYREVKSQTVEEKKEALDYYYAIADACLVNPTLNEIKEHGLELTDMQLITLFQFSQGGLEGYRKFRSLWRGNEDNNNSK